MAREIRTFIEHLEKPCQINAAHDTDIIRFEGGIPHNKKGMLELLDNMIPKVNEKSARTMREMLHKATF